MGATTFLGVFMTKKHKSEKKSIFREKPRLAALFAARILDLPIIFINETLMAVKLVADMLKTWNNGPFLL